MKRVTLHREHCMGCGLCEVACATVHSESGDVVIAHNEEGVPSRKAVHRQGAKCLPVSCRHCTEPACVTACISGALTKNPETGRTEYDEERCVGCMSCVMVCHFGAIRADARTGKIAKCDLCEQRGAPACVDACPNRALSWEDK